VRKPPYFFKQEERAETGKVVRKSWMKARLLSKTTDSGRRSGTRFQGYQRKTIKENESVFSLGEHVSQIGGVG